VKDALKKFITSRNEVFVLLKLRKWLQ
jgi:hypothetical protein